MMNATDENGETMALNINIITISNVALVEARE